MMISNVETTAKYFRPSEHAPFSKTRRTYIINELSDYKEKWLILFSQPSNTDWYLSKEDL